MASVTVCTFLVWFHILAQHQEECGERAKLFWTPTKHNGTLSQTQMLEFISIPWKHVYRTCVFLASPTPPGDLAQTGTVKEALVLVSLSDRPLMERSDHFSCWTVAANASIASAEAHSIRRLKLPALVPTASRGSKRFLRNSRILISIQGLRTSGNRFVPLPWSGTQEHSSMLLTKLPLRISQTEEQAQRLR